MPSNPLDPEPSAVPSEAIVWRRFLARVIDDLLLTVVSLLIVIAASELIQTTQNSTSAPFGSTKIGVVAGIVALIAAALFVLYARWAANRPNALAGVTLGRSITRLRIVDGAGLTPKPALLMGREFTRVALVCAALGVFDWTTGPISNILQQLAVPDHAHTFGIALPTVIIGLPVLLVAALWSGTALLDPLGRAPHDRLARTRVVAA